MEEKAEELHQNLDSADDLKRIIGEIAELPRNEREAIKKIYDENYSDNGGLLNDLEEKLEGNFGDLASKMFQTRAELGAKRLEEAFGVFSEDPEPINEFLFNYPKWLKEEIAKKFEENTGKNLIKEIEACYSSPMKDAIKMFYDSDKSVYKKMNKTDCKNLAKNFNTKDPVTWMEDKANMKKFANMTPEELVQTCREYRALNEYGFYLVLKTLPENQKKFLKDFLYYSICPPQKYARIIHRGTKEPGVSSNEMLNTIATRNDVDFDLIKDFYKKKYEGDLMEDIENNYDEETVELIKKLVK